MGWLRGALDERTLHEDAKWRAYCAFRAGANLEQQRSIERLTRRLYRRRRHAAGLCVECGRTLDGHWCPQTGE